MADFVHTLGPQMVLGALRRAGPVEPGPGPKLAADICICVPCPVSRVPCPVSLVLCPVSPVKYPHRSCPEGSIRIDRDLNDSDSPAKALSQKSMKKSDLAAGNAHGSL